MKPKSGEYKLKRPNRCKPITKERLLKKVKEVEGPLETKCWEWQGQRNKGTNYGIIDKIDETGRHSLLTHRLNYELFVGQIPDDLSVLHKCDNRPCISPDHLFLGTQTDNMIDCVLKKRHSFGERNGRSTLTEEDVRHIKFLLRKDRSIKHIQKVASDFHVGFDAVYHMLQGRTWKHVNDDLAWSTPTLIEITGCN